MKEWRVDEAFLLLFTKDQLQALAREWKVGKFLIHCGDKRSDQIAELLRVNAAAAKKLPPPKILQKAK